MPRFKALYHKTVPNWGMSVPILKQHTVHSRNLELEHFRAAQHHFWFHHRIIAARLHGGLKCRHRELRHCKAITVHVSSRQAGRIAHGCKVYPPTTRINVPLPKSCASTNSAATIKSQNKSQQQTAHYIWIKD
eukprot:5975703-Amphidinium_carterae.1